MRLKATLNLTFHYHLLQLINNSWRNNEGNEYSYRETLVWKCDLTKLKYCEVLVRILPRIFEHWLKYLVHSSSHKSMLNTYNSTWNTSSRVWYFEQRLNDSLTWFKSWAFLKVPSTSEPISMPTKLDKWSKFSSKVDVTVSLHDHQSFMIYIIYTRKIEKQKTLSRAVRSIKLQRRTFLTKFLFSPALKQILFKSHLQ